jgi:hypothetical protein
MKRLVLAVLTVALLGRVTPAQASSITMDFSGTVDLSSAGGLASNLYSGSVSWDPATPSSFTSPDAAYYHPTSDSLIFDGTDQTANTNPAHSYVIVVHDPAGDQFDFYLSSNFGAGGIGDPLVTEIDGDQQGTMFSSTALPGNLDFLASASNAFSVTYTNTLPSDYSGTLTAEAPASDPVPEPASIMLLGTGLLMVGRRFRHRRSAPKISK